jgi:hypothetical protein
LPSPFVWLPRVAEDTAGGRLFPPRRRE